MLSVELWDGSVMTYPQSMNPKYFREESNGKFTSTDGELVLPSDMVKSISTAWPHKMQTTQDAETAVGLRNVWQRTVCMMPSVGLTSTAKRKCYILNR